MQARTLVAIALLFCLSLTLAQPVLAEEGPRELVVRYMDALKKKDVAGALRCLGVELVPAAKDALRQLLDLSQEYFIWAVKDYRIVTVRRDGGLALVTVQEMQFRDVSVEARQELEESAPWVARNFGWGDHAVYERFVLIHLDGRWQFDNAHSGVQASAAMKAVASTMTARFASAAERQDKVQRHLVRFVNGVGFGQVLQSVAPYGPFIQLGLTLFSHAPSQAGIRARSAR